MFTYRGFLKTVSNPYIRDLPSNRVGKEGLASNLDIILTRWIADRKVSFITTNIALEEALGLDTEHIIESDHRRVHESLLRLGWKVCLTSNINETFYIRERETVL